MAPSYSGKTRITVSPQSRRTQRLFEYLVGDAIDQPKVTGSITPMASVGFAQTTEMRATYTIERRCLPRHLFRGALVDHHRIRRVGGPLLE